MYNFDLVLLILDLLPRTLRSATILVAIIEALTAPLKSIIQGFPAYAQAMARQARWNGQRAIMEAAINEMFPEGGGLIVVETVTSNIPRAIVWYLAEGQPPRYIYTLAEGQPPQYIYTHAEMLAFVDFQVLVPTGTVVNFDTIRRFVERLRIAGKRFEVILY